MLILFKFWRFDNILNSQSASQKNMKVNKCFKYLYNVLHVIMSIVVGVVSAVTLKKVSTTKYRRRGFKSFSCN